MAISFWRFIQIYIVASFVCAFFIVLGYKVINRDYKNRLNQIFFGFSICISLSLVLNMIYASFTKPILELFANFLHLLAIFCLSYSLGIMTLFILLLFKPEIMGKSKNQFGFLILYAFLLSLIFFIPDGVNIEILNNGSQQAPEWNLFLFSYISICLTLTLIFSVYILFRIYKTFQSKILLKRLKFFIVGFLSFYYVLMSIFTNNFLNMQFLRLLHTTSAIFDILGAISFYYALGSPLRESENVFPKEIL